MVLEDESVARPDVAAAARLVEARRAHARLEDEIHELRRTTAHSIHDDAAVFGNGTGTEIETSPPPVVRAGPPLPFTHAVSPMRVPSSGGTQAKRAKLRSRSDDFWRAQSLECQVRKALLQEETYAQPESLLSLFLPPTIQQRSVGRDDLDPSLPEHSTATALLTTSTQDDLPPVFSEMQLETTSDYDLLRRLGNL